ncbi:MAG: hypothetical protein JSV21_10010 [Nitrospirota bacterium]|nr:MAG: hypothetical protein JSV21_10010 [Nitrospirota bacterium]
MVLEVIAKDNKGTELKETKSYYEIGNDLDGFMRYGAWQIKEIVDLTLQPLVKQKEKYVFEFKKDATEADVTVNLYYYISGKKGDKIYSKSKKLKFVEE